MVPTSELVDRSSTDAQVTNSARHGTIRAPGCYLLSKSLVKGANCHPIFGLGLAAFGEIQWNFGCLCLQQGRLAGHAGFDLTAAYC